MHSDPLANCKHNETSHGSAQRKNSHRHGRLPGNRRRGGRAPCRRRFLGRGQLLGKLWRPAPPAPFDKKPFRVHIDPSNDGAAVAFTVIDRARNEMLNRVGLSDLLEPHASA